MLHKDIGGGEHHGGAVYNDGHTALQQFGGHHVGPLGAADGFEGGAGPVADEFLHIVGIQHAVDLDGGQAAAQLGQHLLVHHALHKAEAERGFRLLAGLLEFELQIVAAYLAADHGDIGEHALGEALPRAAEHLLRFRLGDGAHGKPLGVEDQRFVAALAEEQRIAVEHVAHHGVHVTADFQLIDLDDLPGHGAQDRFALGGRALPAGDGPQDVFVDDAVVDHAVAIEDAAGQGRLAAGLELPLDDGAVAFIQAVEQGHVLAEGRSERQLQGKNRLSGLGAWDFIELSIARRRLKNTARRAGRLLKPL